MQELDIITALKETGHYRTPPENRSWLARRCQIWASLKFHVCNTYIVCYGAHQARTGTYANPEWFHTSNYVLNLVERAGGELNIEGYDTITSLREPVVFIGNHMSLLETFLLPSLLLTAGDVSFVVKKALTTYPVFGHIMRATKPIAVNRQNPREDLKTVLQEGAELLGQNRSVVIFPQATRAEFSEAKFNTLGAKLAARAEVPVVPFAVKTDFLANGRFIKDMGKVHPERPVHIAFGPVLRTQDHKQLHADTVDFIRTKLSEWTG